MCFFSEIIGPDSLLERPPRPNKITVGYCRVLNVWLTYTHWLNSCSLNGMADVDVERKNAPGPGAPREAEGDEEPEPRPPGQRRLSFFRQHPRAKWVILGVVVAIAGATFLIWQYESQRESTDDARIEGHIDPISPRVGGHVIAVNFEDNQYV